MGGESNRVRTLVLASRSLPLGVRKLFTRLALVLV